MIVLPSSTPIISYTMYSQFPNGFCPGSGQDRVSSHSSQEGPWLKSRNYPIPPHAIAGGTGKELSSGEKEFQSGQVNVPEEVIWNCLLMDSM